MAVIRNPAAVEGRRGTIYPTQFKDGLDGRIKRALGDAGGLSQFGANLTTLEPGAISAQRHWHSSEDEFVYILDGTLTLVTDAGEEQLSAGMAAAFPAGEANGHQIVNRSNAAATYLEIGTRMQEDDVVYSDIDLRMEKRDGQRTFKHRNGEPYV